MSVLYRITVKRVFPFVDGPSTATYYVAMKDEMAVKKWGDNWLKKGYSVTRIAKLGEAIADVIWMGGKK